MKNGKVVLIVLAGILSAGMVCTEKAVEAPLTPAVNRAIGTWKMSMPLMPFMPETLNVTLVVKPDSQFTLNLTKRISAQLYNSEGAWTTTDDSIFLHSSKCLVIDTTPEPDTLKNLGDSLCHIPIALEQPVVETEWNIDPKKLAGMLNGFPVPKDILNQLLPLLGNLNMKKVSAE